MIRVKVFGFQSSFDLSCFPFRLTSTTSDKREKIKSGNRIQV